MTPTAHASSPSLAAYAAALMAQHDDELHLELGHRILDRAAHLRRSATAAASTDGRRRPGAAAQQRRWRWQNERRPCGEWRQRSGGGWAARVRSCRRRKRPHAGRRRARLYALGALSSPRPARVPRRVRARAPAR
eukprot:1550242-Prymnesium_polylepis.1